MSKHWLTMLLGLIVALVFLIAVFSFQVESTQKAVVTTFGKITSTEDAGLHFRWPYPIQKIHTFDTRWRCFEGNIGKLEEILTKDGRNVLVGIYVIYQIEDPAKFFTTVQNISTGEDRLNSKMRTIKNQVIGRYGFDQLVNTDPKEMKLNEVSQEIKKDLAEAALAQYGIKVVNVGISSLGLPKQNTTAVFNRMVKEREVEAKRLRAEGKSEAQKIRYQANLEKSNMIADAEAKAKRIRAEGDAEAAKHYAVFRKSPELAAFLRKLDSMRKIMGDKTTLILDTEAAPFDILKLDPGKIQKQSGK